MPYRAHSKAANQGICLPTNGKERQEMGGGREGRARKGERERKMERRRREGRGRRRREGGREEGKVQPCKGAWG